MSRLRPILAALLLLALGAAGAGCRREPAPSADAVARVGDREIRFEALSAYLAANLGEPTAQTPPAVLSALFDQLIDEQCLLELARSRGLATETTSPRVALQALLEEELAGELPAGLTRAYYQENLHEFERPERVRLRQILVDERQVAGEALAELEGGATFPEVAERYSVEPRAGRGGEQGVFAREDLPSAFEEAIFQLAPGEISEIIAADYGFHIFQVVERYPEEVLPYAAAAPEIRQRLERERTEALHAEVLIEARRSCRAVVFSSNLPFPYRGIHDHTQDH